MTKRRADFDIQDDENGEPRLLEKPEYEGKINTQEEIAQRRILKIKGPKQVSDKKGEGVKFQLNTGLDSSSDKSPEKEAPSFLSNPPASNLPSVFSDKSISSVSPSLLSLFGQNKPFTTPAATTEEQATIDESKKHKNEEKGTTKESNDSHKPEQKEETSDKKEKSTPTPPVPESKPSLFSFLNTGAGSIFSNPLTNTKPNEGENNKTENAPKTGGLFGDLFNKTGGGTGLFASLGNTTNLFSTGNTLNPGLLSSGPALNSSLLSSKPQFSLLNTGVSTGLLTFDKVSEGTSADFFNNNEDEGDDPKEESPDVDPTKSKGEFQYEATTEKLYTRNVNKFKVNNQDPFESGFLSLEKALDSDLYYLIFRNSVKLILYRGIVFKKASKWTVLNNKNDCVSVIVFGEKKNPEEKKEGEEKKLKDKFSTDTCKLMFLNEDDCKAFKEKFNQLTS